MEALPLPKVSAAEKLLGRFANSSTSASEKLLGRRTTGAPKPAAASSKSLLKLLRGPDSIDGGVCARPTKRRATNGARQDSDDSDSDEKGSGMRWQFKFDVSRSVVVVATSDSGGRTREGVGRRTVDDIFSTEQHGAEGGALARASVNDMVDGAGALARASVRDMVEGAVALLKALCRLHSLGRCLRGGGAGRTRRVDFAGGDFDLMNVLFLFTPWVRA